MNKRNSYTSADSKPVKLIQNPAVLHSIQSGRTIPPVHAQVILTNKCNLKCSFCSCHNDDRHTEMGYETALELIETLRTAGTEAVTITGGGEPLLHPKIADIIKAFLDAGIRVGLVTNGLLLSRISSSILNLITWIRISHSSSRDFKTVYKAHLASAVALGHSVDWAFSYVVTADTEVESIIPIVKFANRNDFTHVRLVADLFHPEEIDMRQIAIELDSLVDDSKVIYQPRQTPEKGGECFLGLLKPLISADGKIYACCGVQYALEEPSKKLPFELCLGSAGKLQQIIDNCKPIDGSICKRCYYGEYNRTLKSMLNFAEEVDHKEFV